MNNNYDIVQYVENTFEIKLLEYQKQFLRKIQQFDKPIYITTLSPFYKSIFYDEMIKWFIEQQCN